MFDYQVQLVFSSKLKVEDFVQTRVVLTSMESSICKAVKVTISRESVPVPKSYFFRCDRILSTVSVGHNLIFSLSLASIGPGDINKL